MLYNNHMSILSKFLSRQNSAGNDSAILPSQPSTQPFSLLADVNDYKSNFADIRAIAIRFDKVVPYAVDQNRNRLQVTPTPLAKLFTPNVEMNYYAFIDNLASTILSQERCLVRVVWLTNNAGAELKHVSDNIAGYVFLPWDSKVNLGNGNVYYQYVDSNGELQRVDPDSVMEFNYSTDPESYGSGVSPAQATKKWATIADYIAAYQAGFFQNGAKPDGMFIITASSQEQYQKAKEQLEKVHRRGSHGHFSYQYAYRPTDASGNPLKTTSVEWVSFGASNKDLTLGELLDKTQERQDSAYGVPAIARGNDATATYSNAEVSDRNLALVVEWLLNRVWFQFYHEIDRITDDDLQWDITFDYDVPALADAEKVHAETDKTRVDSMIALVNAGATPKDAAVALGLGKNWQNLTLAKQEQAPALSAPEEQDANDAEPTVIGIATSRRFRGDKLTPRQKLVRCIVKENKRILAKVQDDAKKNEYTPTQEEVDKFADEMASILEPLAVEAQARVIKAIARKFKLELPDRMPTAMDSKRWWDRIATVAMGHDEYIARRIEQAIIKAEDDGLAKAETQKLLSKIVGEEEAAEMARNEIINSERYAHLEADRILAELNGLVCYKTWVAHIDDRTCALCRKMNGVTKPLNEPFAKAGDVVEADGTSFPIDWLDLDCPDAHNRCRCTFSETFKVA